MGYIKVRPKYAETFEAIRLTEQNAGSIIRRINRYADFSEGMIYTDDEKNRYIQYSFGEGYKNYIAIGNWVVFGEYGFVHGTDESFEEDYEVVLTDSPADGILD